MKNFSKFLNTISGLYRLIMTISFFLAMLFCIFVDKNLLTAFYDLVGFDSISPAIIKPISFLAFFIAFILNATITKRIFASNKSGQYHLFNMSFAFIFFFLALFLKFFTKENLFYIAGLINLILIIGSMFGLAAKAKGQYNTNKELVDHKKDLVLEEKDIEKTETIKEEELEVESSEIIPKDQVVEEDTKLDEKATTEDIEKNNLEDNKKLKEAHFEDESLNDLQVNEETYSKQTNEDDFDVFEEKEDGGKEEE